MNRKTLAIALALSVPAYVAVGCGTMNTSNSNLDQVAQPPYSKELDKTVAESRSAPEDIADAVFAEASLEETTAPAAPEIGMQPETVPPLSRPEVRTFYFATDDSSVQQQDFDQLIAHADYLMQNPDVILRISGHTDQSGSKEYNQHLARKRAESIARVLVDYGVPASQVEIESLGEEHPVAGLEHAGADRRVELKYVDEARLSDANSF